MLKNQRAMLWLILIIAGLVLLQVSKGKRAQLNRDEEQVLKRGMPMLPSSSPFPGLPGLPRAGVKPSPAALPKSSLSESVSGWARFKEKYGEHLVARFSSEHFVTSIQGEVGRGVPVGLEFDSTNESQLKERASEILHSLSQLIGERKEWPIEFIEVRGGPSSGQVFFRETYDGLVVKPLGMIKVDFGPKGELLGFYSDYDSQVQAVVPAVLSEGEVQDLARKALGLKGRMEAGLSAMRPGERIVWVSAGKARVAYEFFVEGRNIVVDAQTGRTILFRDRRHY
jgi:hypothetical protein